MALPKRAPASTTATASVPLSLSPGLPFPEPVFTGKPGPTNLRPEFQDVFFITGKRGSGKSTFCLGIENPANVLFLDYEGKGKGLTNQLPGINYFPVIEDVAESIGIQFKGRSVWDRTLQILTAVPENRFTTLIIDNGAYLQDGAADMIADNPTGWGVKANHAATGQYGGVWPGVKVAISGFLALARQKGIQLVVVTFQTKPAWTGAGPSLTKVATTQVAVWHEHSILTLALGESLPQYLPVPTAIVLKEQLPRIVWDPETNKIKVQRCLPFQLPQATMETVKHYLENPVDLHNPGPGEMPDPEVVDSYSTTFKKEQLTTLLKIMELANELSESPEAESTTT